MLKLRQKNLGKKALKGSLTPSPIQKELVTMPFPKSAQVKGGKAAATEFQKQAARLWMQTHRPWERSPGPKSSLGKLTSRYNALKPGIYRKFVKSWETEDFEAACQEIEAAIAAFEADRQQYPEVYHSLQVRHFQGATATGEQWILCVIYVTYNGTEATIQPRVRIAAMIQKHFGTEGKTGWTELLYELPEWLKKYLEKSIDFH